MARTVARADYAKFRSWIGASQNWGTLGVAISPDVRLPGTNPVAHPPELLLFPHCGPIVGGMGCLSQAIWISNLRATIGDGLGFSDLPPHSDEMDISEGVRVRVLNLEMVISIKEQLASEKDLAMLPILRQTLRESKRKRNP